MDVAFLLKLLPHGQGESFYLTVIEGKTLAEAAEVMGMSVATTKAHRYRALNILGAGVSVGLNPDGTVTARR